MQARMRLSRARTNWISERGQCRRRRVGVMSLDAPRQTTIYEGSGDPDSLNRISASISGASAAVRNELTAGTALPAMAAFRRGRRDGRSAFCKNCGREMLTHGQSTDRLAESRPAGSWRDDCALVAIRSNRKTSGPRQSRVANALVC